MTAALYPVKIGLLAETNPSEHRVALVPEVVARLTFPHFRVMIEAGAGARAGFTDTDYRQAGAQIELDRRIVLSQADVVLAIQPVGLEDVAVLHSGAVTISALQPDVNAPLIEALAAHGVAAFSLNAWLDFQNQGMDALSSRQLAPCAVHLLSSLIHHGMLNVNFTDERIRRSCMTYGSHMVNKLVVV